MKKYRLYYDKDKEQRWLNKLCSQGYAMKSYYLGLYTFEKCSPGEYIYQIDLLEDKPNAYEDFKVFMEEVGVEVVQKWNRWIILRKPASEGAFELYTDDETRAAQYKRIRNMFIPLACMEAFFGTSELLQFAGNGRMIFLGFGILLLAFAVGMFSIMIDCTRKIKKFSRE